MHRLAALALLLTLSGISPALSGCGTDPCAVSGKDPATASSTVTLDYIGRLESGAIFDQGACSQFSLQRVIPGFRDGVIGMRPGDEKTIAVPPEEDYGDTPPPGIPPGDTLTFDVRLLQVQ